MKYVIGMCVILAFLLALSSWRNNALQKENNALKTEKNGLTIELKRRNENVLALSERNKKLEQAAAIDKTAFDWSYRIYNSPVIDELRKQCQACPSRADKLHQ